MFKQIGLIALQCAAFWGFIFDLLRPFAVKPHARDEKLRPCFLTIAIKRLACGISIGESISMVYLDRNSRMFYHIYI